ncbi:hypothetical protein ACFOSV_14085 [Algoriphagus namhaensis]|uniref:YtxH domain-containing protein n=1 Tax=Algoriphagus namhaensis TaxID=915353 RepID=A0ABV8ATN1_9BACT
MTKKKITLISGLAAGAVAATVLLSKGSLKKAQKTKTERALDEIQTEAKALKKRIVKAKDKGLAKGKSLLGSVGA